MSLIRELVSPKELEESIVSVLRKEMTVEPDSASDEQFYKACAVVLRDLLGPKRKGILPLLCPSALSIWLWLCKAPYSHSGMLTSKTEGMHSWPGTCCNCRNNPVPAWGWWEDQRGQP